MPCLQVAICSDLHLEFFNSVDDCQTITELLKIDEKCDTLIIAGDFGHPYDEINENEINLTFYETLKKLKQRFLHVLFVPGNHEYYQIKKHSKTFDQTESWIKNICDDIGIIFLQKKSWIHPLGVEFLGCTLWSSIDSEGLKFTNNFKYLFDTKSQCDQLHTDHVEWMKESFKKRKQNENNYPIIAITHNVPSFRPISQINDHIRRTAFATDLEYMFEKPLVGWICGHFHNPISIKINDIWLHMNPVGYSDEKMSNPRNVNTYTFNY